MPYEMPTEYTDDPMLALTRAVAFEVARRAGDPAARMENDTNDVALEDYVLVGQAIYDGRFAHVMAMDLIRTFGEDATIAVQIMRDSYAAATDALDPQEV